MTADGSPSLSASTDLIPLGDPWLARDYWSTPGPLESLLQTGEFPQTPHWRVQMFTSEDGEEWSEGQTIAHSLSSLGLLIFEDTLILTGTPSLEGADDRSIYALTSTNGLTWRSREWSVSGTDGVHDASLYIDEQNRVNAVFAEGGLGLRTAVRDNNRFVTLDEVPLTEPGLREPTSCTWQGRDYLFAVEGTSSIVAASAADGEPLTEDERFVWDGFQAPFCFVEDDELWLLAQAAGGGGKPMYRVLEDSGEFGPMNNLLQSTALPFASCTSPVMGRYGETFVLFCSAWWD